MNIVKQKIENDKVWKNNQVKLLEVTIKFGSYI